ncbi:hypothetical protein OEZ85_010756 [Tetradesmus obliquus]|uniref:Uncharacterized protein n=1 Tax=Tetradesmus obliquus TaxID=3088 RepID=A0ABY8TN71_TETOB|nr:hypothetical protein OEZ85_010756 [Tetradesmus obliquus]
MRQKLLKRIEDRPTKKRRRAQQTADEPDDTDSEDDEEGEEDGFWLSPRMACRLHFAGCLFVDNWREDLGDKFEIEMMPPVVKPFVRRK